MTMVGTEGTDGRGADVHVSVTVGATGQEFFLSEDEGFTFGRSPDCTVVLDPTDRSISRLAGAIVCERGHWYIVNRSTVRPMRVIDSSGYGARTLAASSATSTSRHPLEPGRVTVVVPGNVGHVLTVDVSIDDEDEEGGEFDGPPTESTDIERTVGLRLTPRQRDVLVAMAWGYVQPYPRFHPTPATYAEVGRRLGISPRRVERHVADIRARMMAANLPDLADLADARARVCELAVALRLVDSQSAAALDERLAGGGDTPA